MTRQWPKHQLYTTTLFRYVIGGELCANIDFAADNRAIMYVNGRYVGAVLHRAHVRRIRLKLSIGDTIAVRAQSFGGGFGFIAHISLPRGRYIVTGHPGWKVMKGNWRDSRNPRGWMTTGFKQGCSWKHATRVRKRFSPAIPRTFPISNGPKYIWVGNSGSRAVTLIRYVVGGERCSKIPPNSFPAKITVAADNLAWLYINGIFVRKVRDWRKFQTLPTRLKDGDVIGLRVKNLGHWYGAIANVEYKGHNFGTGHPDWKAINVRHYSGKGKLGWAKRGYNSCQWYPAVKLPKPNSIHPGKAPGFPYKTGALYVWGRGAGARDIVLLRYVVGGEACRRKISFTADDRASLYINGHLRARSLQWWRAKKVITPLRTGDVVTVVAENRRGAHGVKAAITQPGLVMVTGSLGWKAIKIASSFHGVELWKKRKYRACGWPAPIVVGHSSHYRSRRVHGLPRNSKWVWASRAGKTGKVILRYVIGGEYCPKRKVPNAVITFAARSKVTLLINGKIIASTNGFRAKVVRAELGTGDAVSFVVSNRRVGIAGGIADIFFWKTGKHFPTGRHGWKATRAFAGFGTKWDSRKFRSCSWLPAKPISRFVKLPLFKVPAKLVWADKVKYSGPIFLRYVVGGEQCAPSPPPPNPKSGVVTLTADNGAIVFINGKPFGHVRSWREVLRLPIQFEDGDVIGIAAHDSGFWFGVKAIVSIGKKFPTGASGWKAKAGLGKKELQKFRWARGDFSSCKWKEPAVRPDPHRKFRSIAPRFPHVVGLQNVWAQHARVGQVAFFRFVVGGEKC